ncbi:MAG TPA: tyrosine-type recombinase/integrase [Verrucomicrobiae bacterium]|nr:tyrosine-type recombinase/integrase [Verrucomicrobiae bacterium]
MRYCSCEREQTESKNVWQKTPVSNLVRYVASGILFARIRVQGKLIRRSLKTKVLSVAKLRLGANACRKLSVPHISHHDLRHLFATTCIESGVDIPTVSRWLGHQDGGALRHQSVRFTHPSLKIRLELFTPTFSSISNRANNRAN